MNIDCEDQIESNDESNETILDFYPDIDNNINMNQNKIQNQEADLFIQINNESEISQQEQETDDQLQKKSKLKKKSKKKCKKKKKKKKIVIIAKEKAYTKSSHAQSLKEAKRLNAKELIKRHPKSKSPILLQVRDSRSNEDILHNKHSDNNEARKRDKSPGSPNGIAIYKRKSLKPIVGSQLKQIKEKEQYADRLIRIRKDFIDKQLHNFNHEKVYSYVILPGNSSYQIKNCMKHRLNWREAQTNVTSLFNFKWKPTRLCIDFNSLSITKSIPQIVNHFECHHAITKKSEMFFNLFSYCELNKLNVFKYVPFTILHTMDSDIANFEALFNNIDSYLADYEAMCRYREVNKKLSYAYMFGFYGSEVGYKAPMTIPRTHYTGRNMWVIKATNLNRGQCIRVVDSIESLKKVIKTFQSGIRLLPEDNANDINSNNKNVHPSQEQADEEKKEKERDKENAEYQTDKIIIQKYIESPLLYKGRKCDIRIWVLVTQDMEGYVYKEGHLKTCSVDYDLNAKDAFVHITNYSYQKHCDNFSKFEIGNEVPFHDFQSFLDTQYQSPSISIKNDIMPKIKEIIKASLSSVKDKLNPLNRNYSFELFGYDFMIDSNLDVYLIEINTNPGIEESSPWIKVIIPRMLDDCLRLTIDKLFPPKYSFKFNKKSTIKTSIANCNGNSDGVDTNLLVEKLDSEIKKVKSNNDDEVYSQQETLTDRESNDKRHQCVFDIEKIAMLAIDDSSPKESQNNNRIIKKEEKVCNTEVSSDDKSNCNSNSNNTLNEEYISPYPVPGYSNSENLWEFVCDLNGKKTAIKKEYTGIRHLLFKKKEKDKNKDRHKNKDKDNDKDDNKDRDQNNNDQEDDKEIQSQK